MKRKTAFIAVPLGDEGSEIRRNSEDLFELVIGSAFEKYDYELIRLDKLARSSSITGEVVSIIQEADLCVFDLTYSRPSIMYECGRRHEIGKPFIQMCRKGEVIPFDLAGVRTIIYDLTSVRQAHQTVLALQDYIEAITESNVIYKEPQVNLASIAVGIEQIQRILTAEKSLETKEGFQIIENLFGRTEIKKREGLCFVIMPFTQTWSNRIYRIISECLAHGFDEVEVVRADNLFGQDVLLDIWKAICEAEIVVAEVTGRNPNVFYELGLAHAVGTDVILLSQSSEDIPFDLKRYRHIIYEDNEDGTQLLRIKLQQTFTERTGRKAVA